MRARLVRRIAITLAVLIAVYALGSGALYAVMRQTPSSQRVLRQDSSSQIPKHTPGSAHASPNSLRAVQTPSLQYRDAHIPSPEQPAPSSRGLTHVSSK